MYQDEANLLPLSAARHLTVPADVEYLDLVKDITTLLRTRLSTRERYVICARFGLEGLAEHRLCDIGIGFGLDGRTVSGQCMWLIQQRALKKLRRLRDVRRLSVYP